MVILVTYWQSLFELKISSCFHWNLLIKRLNCILFTCMWVRAQTHTWHSHLQISPRGRLKIHPLVICWFCSMCWVGICWIVTLWAVRNKKFSPYYQEKQEAVGKYNYFSENYLTGEWTFSVEATWSTARPVRWMVRHQDFILKVA